ncbi:MAG: hypothetical protein WCC17_19610 [Candidatus Nitrosopolaris sp.]|jgi:hypothetical protein
MIVKSHRIKRGFLAALADEEMVKIMNCVIYNSKSFNDIVLENNDIPRTTTFRKIRWLLNLLLTKSLLPKQERNLVYIIVH